MQSIPFSELTPRTGQIQYYCITPQHFSQPGTAYFRFFWQFAFLMQKQHPQTAYCKYAILIGTIQAEGAFGQLKHNRSFKRFLTGGNIKVLAELLFLGLSQNSLL